MRNEHLFNPRIHCPFRQALRQAAGEEGPLCKPPVSCQAIVVEDLVVN